MTHVIAELRETIAAALAARGLPPAGEHDRLFSSGLLDSLAATEVLMRLESVQAIDLADEDFDIDRIDTLHGLEQLLAARKARAGQPAE